jgi:hypothetical protein
VDAPERGGAVDQVEAVEHPPGHRVGELAGPLEGLLDPAGHVPRVDAGLLGLGVDRHHPPGAVADQVDDGVGQLLLALVLVELAEEHRLGAGRQLLGPPGLVEELQLEAPGAVADHRTDQRLGRSAPGAAAGHPLDPGQHHRLLAHLQVADVGLVGAVDVAPRVVREQVEHRPDLEVLGQRDTPVGPDALELGDRDAVELAELARHDPSLP